MSYSILLQCLLFFAVAQTSSVTTSEHTDIQNKVISVDNNTNQSCTLLHQNIFATSEQPSCSNFESKSCREQVSPVDLLNDDLLLSSSEPDDSENDKNYEPSPEESSETESDTGSPQNNRNADNILDNPVRVVKSVSGSEVTNRKVLNKTVIRQQGRKRVRNPSQWLSNKRKASYAAGKAYISKKGKNVQDRVMKPPCSCRLCCYEKITEIEKMEIFRSYWDAQKSNDMKRQFIRSCIETKPIARPRSRQGAKSKTNSLTYRFVMNQRVVRVCKVMFLNTLCISNTVVITSLKKEKLGGLVEPDQRGKHTPSNKTAQVVIDNVINHINSFPTYDSH